MPQTRKTARRGPWLLLWPGCLRVCRWFAYMTLRKRPKRLRCTWLLLLEEKTLQRAELAGEQARKDQNQRKYQAGRSAFPQQQDPIGQ